MIRGLYFCVCEPDCCFKMVLSFSLFGLFTQNTGLIVGLCSLPLCAADLACRQLLRQRCRNASYGWKEHHSKTQETQPSKTKHQNAKKALVLIFVQPYDPCFSLLYIDKNFEDDDSLDGGRSSSSSKGASQCGRKPVSMGSFRRPSSAKVAGENRTFISKYQPLVIPQRAF